MAVAALTCFPSSIVAGNTLRVSLSGGDYPSSDWALLVVFNGAVVKRFAADSVADDAYELVITASETAKLIAGTYTLTFIYTNNDDNERASVSPGSVQVLSDPTSASPKSAARIALEALELALPIVASGTEQTVSFNGQSVTFRNIREIQDAIAMQKSVIAREESAADLLGGNRRSRSIYTSFGRGFPDPAWH